MIPDSREILQLLSILYTFIFLFCDSLFTFFILSPQSLHICVLCDFVLPNFRVQFHQLGAVRKLQKALPIFVNLLKFRKQPRFFSLELVKLDTGAYFINIFSVTMVIWKKLWRNCHDKNPTVTFFHNNSHFSVN